MWSDIFRPSEGLSVSAFSFLIGVRGLLGWAQKGSPVQGLIYKTKQTNTNVVVLTKMARIFQNLVIY